MQNLKIVTSNTQINSAIKLALDDISGNIKQYKSTYDHVHHKVLVAGADYDRPWTRDTAINVYNGFSFLDQDVSYNTLMSVLEIVDGKTYIGGQYWDAILWSLGAYQHYLITHNEAFLPIAYEAIKNTMEIRERDEFTVEYGLFRGPAVYGDGVSAYPTIYSCAEYNSSILKYPEFKSEHCYTEGFGIPMHTLSTNVAYLMAYRILIKMTKIRNTNEDIKQYRKKEEALFSAIQQHFVYTDERLKYIVGKHGDCIRQEGLGISFALMANIVGEKALNHIYSSNSGIPCVFPTYSRYQVDTDYGRHSGTVWPHVQGFFAVAALKHERHDMFMHEFELLTAFSNRDQQFHEIYHPDTGLPYGGLQEYYHMNGVRKTRSCEHQTWSATAYLSMLLYGFAGIEITEDTISFVPYLNDTIDEMEIKNINIADMCINLHISGNGSTIKQMQVNGQTVTEYNIDVHAKGTIDIRIIME
ncbi:MAG: hypothetical protein KAQ68_09535 [Clostridiales bacterium]|nr:hypothetical protein [Clostridiales bacterium]